LSDNEGKIENGKVVSGQVHFSTRFIEKGKKGSSYDADGNLLRKGPKKSKIDYRAQ